MQSQKDKVTLTPIGILRTEFDHKFGTPRQGALAPSSRAWFELSPEWRGKGLFCNLEGFSHVWILSLFHQNKNTRAAGKVHPPRLLGEAVGILASRSPHRPNPIGLTLARIESVNQDTLILSGVDLVDGTPVLDIKPYLPEADRPQDYTVGWPSKITASDADVQLDAGVREQIAELHARGDLVEIERFLELVQQVLRLDPRPLAYRKRINERFAVVIGGLDVHARYNDGVFTVIEVAKLVAPATTTPPR